MKLDKVVGRGMMLAVCVIGLLMASGCVSLGPPGATGAQAVISGPVESSGGPIRVVSRGETFFIKFADSTGLGLNLRPDISSALTAMGMREVFREEDAVFVIDAVTENFFSGKGNGPNAGTVTGAVAGAGLAAGLAESGVIDPGAALGVGLGAMLVGAMIDSASTPSYVGAELNVVIDELLPVSSKKGKKSKQAQEPESVQHATVFRAWVKFMDHQCTPPDALGVVKGNLVRAVADMFR